METKSNLHGIIKGNIVELATDPGIESGQAVEVTLRVMGDHQWGDGLRRCAGAFAETWTDEDDKIFEEIQRDRSKSNSRELPS